MKLNKYLKGIARQSPFLSNAKRMLWSYDNTDTTPGPGNYAQYSSLKYPLIFPYADNKDTYIVYENGKISRKFQNYAGN